MDTSKAVKIVTDSLGSLKWGMGLAYWEISVDVDALPKDQLGSCCPDPAYRHAVIILDPTKHQNEEKLLNTLRHELLHCVISQLGLVRDSVLKNTTDYGQENMIKEHWRQNEEQVVQSIEDMLYYVDLSPKQMIANAKKKMSSKGRKLEIRSEL